MSHYVHLFASNYLKHGITQKGGQEISKNDTILSNYLTRKKESAAEITDKKTREDYAATYESLLKDYSNGNSDTDEAFLINQMQGIFKQIVEEKMKAKVNLDFSTARGTLGGTPAEEIFMKALSQVELNSISASNSATVQQKTIETRLDAMQKILTTFNNETRSQADTLIGLSDMKVRIDSMESKLALLKNIFASIVAREEQKAKSNASISFRTHDSKVNLTNRDSSTTEKLITEINRLIRSFYYATGLAQLLGIIGEVGGATADFLNELKKETLERNELIEELKTIPDKISKSIVGQDISYNVSKSSLISIDAKVTLSDELKKVGQKKQVSPVSWAMKTENGNIEIITSTTPTQQKVDIRLKSIKLNKDFEALGSVGASVKNYSALGAVTIVDNTTLSTLIQNIDSNFEYHYLNIMASHSVKNSPVGETEERGSISIISALRQQHNDVITLFGINSLIGAGTKINSKNQLYTEEGAQVLVAIQNGENPKVSVIDMGLATKAITFDMLRATGAGSQKNFQLTKNSQLGKQELDSDYGKTRLDAVLAQAKEKKMHIAINLISLKQKISTIKI